MPNWTDLGRVRLAQADCLEALADLGDESANAVILDPPYCAGGFTEAARTAAPGMTKADWFQGDAMTTTGLVWLLRQVAIEAHRILTDKGSLCVFCDWRMVAALAPALESSGLRWRNLVVWDKLSTGLGSSSFRARHELVLHFAKGTSTPRYDVTVGNVIPAKRVAPAKRNHPTAKPVDLLETIIRATTPEDGTVVDVFAGGGSLAEAALRTGRRAIVSDISPVHVAAIRARVEAIPVC